LLAGPVFATWLRRARRTRALAACVAVGLVLGFSAPAAVSQTADPSTAQLRSEVDAINTRYFATLADFTAADAAVRDNEAVVAELRARAARAKAQARARALLAYKSSGAGLAAVVEGTDTLDAAKRAHLIDRVNARDRSVYKSLRVTVRELKAKQQALRDARERQEQSLSDLQAQGRALDAKLAQAQARASAAATADTQRRQAEAAITAAASTTTTTTTTAPPSTPTAPPGYSGTPGTSPHHDDPFLTCVRARESGGNYAAVNPSGPYLGAYQFFQATWNGAAAHAGRMDLVGVPANVASPYDQDEIAWTLYQWQGAGPWGGHCP
jgi:septal ring factor EnvC (AmiA/AmiB activator)